MTDIIIIGAGTAGMTAALYALRAGSSVLLFESETIGGQISFTPRVENYPAIMQISGTEFSSNLFDQIERLGAKYEIATVTKIEKIQKSARLYSLTATDNTLNVAADNLTCIATDKTVDMAITPKTCFSVLADGKTYYAKSVIIASGVKPRRLGLPRENELVGEGVCYCAVCDGAFYKGKNVAVCGGGNSALTDALFLSAYCKNVTLIHRKSAFNAEKTLIDRVLTKPNIQIIYNCAVSELVGSPSLSAIRIASTDSNDTRKDGANSTTAGGLINAATTNPNRTANDDSSSKIIDVEALFVAIGHQPDNASFGDIVTLNKEGYIIAGDDCKTSTSGVFAAGDCRTKALRQLTTATADGAVCGLAASQYADALK